MSKLDYIVGCNSEITDDTHQELCDQLYEFITKLFAGENDVLHDVRFSEEQAEVCDNYTAILADNFTCKYCGHGVREHF